MRKKSHISLAGQMMKSMELEKIMKHRLTFYLGSILPDCRPSFLTTPHSFDETFLQIGEQMRKMVHDFVGKEHLTMAGTIQLGEVTHYIADYFTFPHNKHYTGNLKDHCTYEGDLKRRLKEFIQSGKAMELRDQVQVFDTVEELISYIRQRHQEYMSRPRCIREDMEYIIIVCSSVMVSLLHMCFVLTTEWIQKPSYMFA